MKPPMKKENSMKVTIKETKVVDKDGNESVVVSFVDEKEKPAKGIFAIKDGRPFDLITGEYLD